MIDEERWRRALLTEIQHTAEETQGRRVGSIFFGGGTPSLMAPETVAATIDHIDKIWRLGIGCCISKLVLKLFFNLFEIDMIEEFIPDASSLLYR